MFQLILFLIVLVCSCSTHITKNLPRVLGDMIFAYFCFLFLLVEMFHPEAFLVLGRKSGFGITLCWQYMIPLCTYYIPLIYHLYTTYAVPWFGGVLITPLKCNMDTWIPRIAVFLRRYLLPNQCMFGIYTP